ncbi:cation channel sperm-associated auxiliary subunit beta-like [Peromyscus californicus insignis]|uniref:cation channel sperm-associated auxiliary subunit beta-like n=1 Tax=Peromyscus californicus insignis TaxID=564181 RepID=UPI0022A75F5F|nr:cation channel sperm-associated auxiliary subunit beta-like [Peromyscus californicus insignis]
MKSPLIYVMILLLNVFEFSSGMVYNKREKENHFVCSSEEVPSDNQIIKLFLSMDSLKVYCFFQSESKDTSRAYLSVFTSGGLAPKLIISNSTYHEDFHFNLSLFNNRALWFIDIPRESITVNTDIAAVEEWIIKVTMHKGLNIYDTEGTLLDLVREPILQWTLGSKMSNSQVKKLFPHVIDIKVAKCPCANDVALFGFILNSTYNGVYIGKTISGFRKYNETTWHDLTDIIYSQLKDEHQGLTIIDMVLTNHFLVILTSLGLYVSSDLRYPVTSHIQLSRADFCGFERVDYIKGKLWYNEKCFANRESFEVDYVTITFDRNRTLSESSSCFYSKEPFLHWLPCLPSTFKSARFLPHVVTFLIDQETKTGIYLFHNQNSKRTSVSVSVLKNDIPNSQPKFPNFQFPSSFSYPVGMVFHPRSHFLYVYGNQVWLSMDGGNTFELVCDFLSNYVRKTVHSFYTSAISLITKNGRIYMTKAGLTRYTNSGRFSDNIFTLYYDHLGFIHKLTPERFDTDLSSSGSGTSSTIFGTPPDLGFDTALAPQYLSPNEMIFFAYVPLNETKHKIYKRKFKNIHIGKVINYSKNGNAYIRKLLVHANGPLGFHTSVLTEIIEPFGVEESVESSSVHGSLKISYTGNTFYHIEITTAGSLANFSDADVEKTVVRPGYSSFLITEVRDLKNVLSLATMPHKIKSPLNFPENSWFLYSFGSTKGRNWTISLKPCNYWVQQDDHDIVSLNVVKYLDVGTKANYGLKLIPNTRGMKLLQVPPVIVVVGNPALLEVKTEGYFDVTDSYNLNAHVASKFFHKGSTSLSIIMWEASTSCSITTVLPIMKSSCSYLRTLQHIPGRQIPPEDWISGVHKDSQGFNMIKTLPINYRPPSNMGIFIPLTDNIYHADPSKPRPRSLFHKSKVTGQFKQCYNVPSREMCNCTEHQKFSHAVAFSDCKEKVHRFKFPVTQYPVTLEIFTENEKFAVEPPYLVTMTEVNMRQNWQLKHNMPENIKKMKDYLEPLLNTSVYNPLGLNISIRGSELFHFKVSVVPGVSFCNLEEEFQIYVDEVPLPFPGHTLIAVATSVVLGGLIFVSFIFRLRNIHPLRAFQRYVRRNTANPSTISISSEGKVWIANK